MNDLLISGAFVFGLPVSLLVIFRANVAIMFFAACAGVVLLDSLDPTVVTTAGAVVPGDGEAYVRLAVIVVTLIFSAMMSRDSVRKMTGYMLHGLLVLLLGLMLWALLPYLSGISWLLNSVDEPVWQYVDDFKTVIIALGFSLSLVVVLKSKPVK